MSRVALHLLYVRPWRQQWRANNEAAPAVEANHHHHHHQNQQQQQTQGNGRGGTVVRTMGGENARVANAILGTK